MHFHKNIFKKRKNAFSQIYSKEQSGWLQLLHMTIERSYSINFELSFGFLYLLKSIYTLKCCPTVVWIHFVFSKKKSIY